jgi:hypothetical protein
MSDSMILGYQGRLEDSTIESIYSTVWPGIRVFCTIFTESEEFVEFLKNSSRRNTNSNSIHHIFHVYYMVLDQPILCPVHNNLCMKNAITMPVDSSGIPSCPQTAVIGSQDHDVTQVQCTSFYCRKNNRHCEMLNADTIKQKRSQYLLIRGKFFLINKEFGLKSKGLVLCRYKSNR